MSIEDLLKVRYKQINDWPFMGNKYKIGNIFTFEHEVESGIVAAYPHLFKKLEWYEDRKPEEMPEYVKINDRIWHVKEWRYYLGWSALNHIDAEGETEHFFSIKWHFFAKESTPSTLEEYTAYQSTKTP